MNKETARIMLPVIQALADGEQIQYHYAQGWSDINCIMPSDSPEKYRKKPVPETIWVNKANQGLTREYVHYSKESAESTAKSNGTYEYIAKEFIEVK